MGLRRVEDADAPQRVGEIVEWQRLPYGAFSRGALHQFDRLRHGAEAEAQEPLPERLQVADGSDRLDADLELGDGDHPVVAGVEELEHQVRLSRVADLRRDHRFLPLGQVQLFAHVGVDVVECLVHRTKLLQQPSAELPEGELLLALIQPRLHADVPPEIVHQLDLPGHLLQQLHATRAPPRSSVVRVGSLGDLHPQREAVAVGFPLQAAGRCELAHQDGVLEQRPGGWVHVL
mmetsp:Transcript_9439/g.26613  ORF Transcript_9439/g.26613 Transcript_9439/m.26613 type:complete len:233 (-) Transcript_9439:974-1672(-)